MKRGDDHVMMLMLKVGEFLGQEAGVMVVDESDRADHKGVGSDHGGAHQAVANEVAESFGAVLVTLCAMKRSKRRSSSVSIATPMRLRSPMECPLSQ